MNFDFDRIIDRRGTNSIKWERYPEDVLPLWVADMDFAAPEPVVAALKEKLAQRIFGYENPSHELREVVAERLKKLYHWQVTPEMVLATPGVVAGFNAAARTVCEQGQAILVQPPVYPPFLKVHEYCGLVRQDAPLALKTEGSTLHYEIDFDVFEQAIHSKDARTRMFLLCNPHNPTGQVYKPEDLARLAEICLEQDVVICSDEIHSELLLDGAVHTPIAALDPAIGADSITLIAPSKTFNIPGLFCGFAIIPNKELFERYKQTLERLSMHVSSFGLAAAQTAYSGECDQWLEALQRYLTGNRDLLTEFVRAELPGVRMTRPDATYLAWMDFNDLVADGRISGTPYDFLLEKARVGLNNGNEFGTGGSGFVRLNFGCPRATLVEALGRIKAALDV